MATWLPLLILRCDGLMAFISNHTISGKLSFLTNRTSVYQKLAEACRSTVMGIPQPTMGGVRFQRTSLRADASASASCSVPAVSLRFGRWVRQKVRARTTSKEPLSCDTMCLFMMSVSSYRL